MQMNIFHIACQKRIQNRESKYERHFWKSINIYEYTAEYLWLYNSRIESPVEVLKEKTSNVPSNDVRDQSKARPEQKEGLKKPGIKKPSIPVMSPLTIHEFEDIPK